MFRLDFTTNTGAKVVKIPEMLPLLGAVLVQIFLGFPETSQINVTIE